jgi:hypothetical protein
VGRRPEAAQATMPASAMIAIRTKSIRLNGASSIFRSTSVIIGRVDGLLCQICQPLGQAQTRLNTTSILPRVALEYAHV